MVGTTNWQTSPGALGREGVSKPHSQKYLRNEPKMKKNFISGNSKFLKTLDKDSLRGI